MKTVLTIAGSDCSGGAGIQADLKTMMAHKLYGMSVITALTAQNTTGVYGVEAVTPHFVRQQLSCIFMDIVPDAVKVGMVANEALIKVISNMLIKENAKNIVIDPVMISTSGHALIDDAAIEAMQTHLLPLATLITPNLMEAERLSGIPIDSEMSMKQAGAALAARYNTSVLVKGGHLADRADDLLVHPTGECLWLSGEKIDNPNTHGTGCTLSSAIACNLAQGMTIETSVVEAKGYINSAISAQLNLGKGRGPLNHCVK